MSSNLGKIGTFAQSGLEYFVDTTRSNKELSIARVYPFWSRNGSGIGTELNLNYGNAQPADPAQTGWVATRAATIVGGVFNCAGVAVNPATVTIEAFNPSTLGTRVVASGILSCAVTAGANDGVIGQDLTLDLDINEGEVVGVTSVPGAVELVVTLL
jgi:hypothetical protein